MTPEDKQLISEYMGLFFDNDAGLYFGKDDDGDPFMFHFDSNDASLCVEKMVENGDWFEFFKMVDDFLDIDCCGVTAWLFNSQDFFTAMASWLRGKQYTPSIRTR